MNCAECKILLHALIDSELDASHTREVEAHLATCPTCSKEFEALLSMRHAMTAADLKETASAHLRNRIETAFPPASTRAAAPRKSWRTFFGGFAAGTALSAALAASLILAVFHVDQDRQIASEVVSAHLRSLQLNHLTDVQTSDQHTVKPWFNGKIDVAPPVTDLTTQGFTLIGGRLDTIDGRAVACVVYQRRKHIINLFVAQGLGAPEHDVITETIQGFNILHWTEEGLDFWAISDIDVDELKEFSQKFAAALRNPPGPS